MSIHIPRRKQLLARVLSVLLAISPFATLAPAAYATGDCGCGESTTDLIAGGGNENSALDVGEVTVSSCEDGGVCVEYSLSDEAIDEGWVITETHAAVGNTEGDIPQTKKGNPTPGQFSHNETHDGVTSFKVCFEGNYASGDELVVAAHAVVVKPTDEWGKVWQIGDVEGTLENGLPTNYANEFNWGPPADEETAGPSLAEDSPAFANPYVVGVNNPEDFPYNSNTLRGYATNFDINWTGELPLGEIVPIKINSYQSIRAS